MKTNNKNIVRLNESQLEQIVSEELNKALNEIGDTPYGQYMLGRLAARQNQYPGDASSDTQLYAHKQKSENLKNFPYGDANFEVGGFKQDRFLKNADRHLVNKKYGDNYSDAYYKMKRDKQEIQNDLSQLAYSSLPSYRKKVDAAKDARDKETRNQMRKKYSFNNPDLDLNESKSVVRLSEAQIKEMVKCALMEVVKENNLDEKFNGKGLATAALGATLALGSTNHAAAQDVNPKRGTTMTYQKSMDNMDVAKDKKTAQLDSIMKKSDDRAKDMKARMDGRAKEMKDRMDANKNKSSFNKQLDSTKSATPKIDHNVKK